MDFVPKLFSHICAYFCLKPFAKRRVYPACESNCVIKINEEKISAEQTKEVFSQEDDSVRSFYQLIFQKERCMPCHMTHLKLQMS